MQTFASVLITIGLCVAVWQYSLIHVKEVAQGTVTTNEKYGSGGSGRSHTYRLVATFHDQAGAEHTYRAQFGVSSTGFEVGDKIRIYFDPRNPADCGVLEFQYRFGIAWAFMVAGLALWLFSAGAPMGNALLEKLMPSTVGQRYEPPTERKLGS